MKGVLCAWAMAWGNEIPVVILLDHFILEMSSAKKHKGLTQTNTTTGNVWKRHLILLITLNNSSNFKYFQKIIFAYERVVFKFSEYVKIKPPIFWTIYNLCQKTMGQVVPAVPPVQCWANKNMMSGRETPTLKRWGEGGWKNVSRNGILLLNACEN